MKQIIKVASYLGILFLIIYLYQIPIGKFHNDKHIPAMEISSPTPTEKKSFTIGWSAYNIDFQYFQYVQQGVLSKAEELGMDVIIHNQGGDPIEMVLGSMELIRQGIDALVISPCLPTALPNIVDLANREGIPIIVVDVGTGGTNVDAFIVSDSIGGGVLAGEYALKLMKMYDLPSKNTAILKLERTQAYAWLRGESFKQVMQQNGYRVVAEIYADGLQEKGYEAMKKILETYGDDLSFVFCENDRMALGAIQAIEEAGKAGQILVLGFDGDEAAIEAIKEGRLQGSIAQQPYEMGEVGVQIAYDRLSGRPIIYDDPVTKEILMEVYLIDKDGKAWK